MLLLLQLRFDFHLYDLLIASVDILEVPLEYK